MTREQAINSMISHGFTVEQAGEIIKAVTPQYSSGLEKNSKKLEKDLGELDCISRKAALDITCQDPSYSDPLNVLTEVRDKIRELPSVTPQLSVPEVTALAEWTEKLTKASEEAYRRGYLDCSEKLRIFQKLHDEERELKDKLNKIDIEDAWKCGFEQGAKHEKLASTNICPHCGEYIGEEE